MLSFSDYIQTTQEHIKTVRQRVALPHDDTVVKMNSPFERRPANFDGQRAVLLIHGFLTSPYVMRAIGEVYLQQGFLVRSILLPGHGTTPDELHQATFEQWQNAVEYGIASLQDEAQELHLCGYSLGATLACLAAAQHSIDSLTLLSPAFGISKFAALLPGVAYLSKHHLAMRYFGVGGKKTGNDLATYRFFPPYGALQVYRAIQKLRSVWAPLIKRNHHKNQGSLIYMPCFIAQSTDDATVKLSPVLQFFKANQHPHSWMRLYARELHSYQGKKMEVIHSYYRQANILDMSHIAIPVPPLDPYYGKAGQCYGAVPEGSYFGEYSRRNLRHNPFYRLSYNPDFWGMAQRLEQFLKAIEHSSCSSSPAR